MVKTVFQNIDVFFVSLDHKVFSCVFSILGTIKLLWISEITDGCHRSRNFLWYFCSDIIFRLRCKCFVWKILRTRIDVIILVQLVRCLFQFQRAEINRFFDEESSSRQHRPDQFWSAGYFRQNVNYSMYFLKVDSVVNTPLTGKYKLSFIQIYQRA